MWSNLGIVPCAMLSLLEKHQVLLHASQVWYTTSPTEGLSSVPVFPKETIRGQLEVADSHRPWDAPNHAPSFVHMKVS